ncbi:MAG: tetratricopeptide repeat protein [Nitrospirales bacterium]|nr:tetratricopeptide repeat protein [Nitrospirales bacterium]
MIDEAELLSGKDRVLFFVEQNRIAIIVGILLTVVVAVALGGLVWLERLDKEKAIVLEGKAQLLYYDRPPDKPEQTQENLGKAADLFRQILNEYPRTSSARRSLFFLGNTLMEQGDLNGATETYQQFIEQYPDDEILLGIVYQRLGYAHLLNGNQDRAYAVFSTVLGLPRAINKDQVLYEVAKLKEAEEKTQEALTSYKQLIEQYPNSPFFSEASLRVKILEPEDVSPAQGKESEKTVESGKSGEPTEAPSEGTQAESPSKTNEAGP